MEILLNLAWASLALAIVGLWFRVGEPGGSNRLRQIVAIAVLIAILFPVISVSDDLLAMQTSSETDNCLRKDQLVPTSPHPLLAAAAILFALQLDAALASVRLGSVADSPDPVWSCPALASIDNRPPPAA